MKSLAVAAAVIVAMALASCGGGDGGSDALGIRVVATTTQIGALTREVAGGKVRLSVLLKAGASAHDFEPGPDTLKEINAARLVLKNGIGLDDWLDKSIKSAGGSKTVALVTEGVKTQKRDDGEEDPHVWHDADNAARMVDNIVAALAAADPPNAATFRANGDAYKQKLAAADKEIRALIETIPVASRKVVTNHDAFGYFLDRYGLTFVGAVIPSTSSEAQPSAKEIAALQDLIRREGVKAIFAEDEIDPKVAREIAKDTGVKIIDDLYADSLGEPGSGADTVDGMLLSNARKIVEALK
ncbi:MAG: zinc ABC transporter substrate-binding protein [Anaerolinea sp.]|nr:zinc ABC transporter substrate-binding protein [Anaerolinea sp.]